MLNVDLICYFLSDNVDTTYIGIFPVELTQVFFFFKALMLSGLYKTAFHNAVFEVGTGDV